MNPTQVTGVVVVAALITCVTAIGLRLNDILHRSRKRELARPAGSRWRGFLYAFTLGMAPWGKESARRHWVAYLRGAAA
jgi:hypothetical protein